MPTPDSTARSSPEPAVDPELEDTPSITPSPDSDPGDHPVDGSVMAVGDESAARPEISFRFSQPENLPRAA